VPDFPYQVQLAASARKELRSFSPEIIARIMRALKELGSVPRPAGAKKLTGQNSSWRVRIGDYRIIYQIDDTQRSVDVIRIAHRGEAYR